MSAAEKTATVTVTETVTQIQAAETPSCPLSGKCPWYEEHKKKDGAEHTECPLSEKCPYYKKHKQDSTIDGLMTEEGHHCPLSNKCPFYKSVKEGKASEIVGKARLVR
jgi:hypothetical protein